MTKLQFGINILISCAILTFANMSSAQQTLESDVLVNKVVNGQNLPNQNIRNKNPILTYEESDKRKVEDHIEKKEEKNLEKNHNSKD